jgi:hypothetical protein
LPTPARYLRIDADGLSPLMLLDSLIEGTALSPTAFSLLCGVFR